MQIETQQDTTAISAQARGAAQQAQTAFLKHWNDTTGGNEYGEPMYCGFAWVTVYPEHKAVSYTHLTLPTKA